MAVINEYKFYGATITTATSANLLSPAINETVIIKSLHVTNKSASNTPTITIKNNTFEVIDTQTLSTAASVEILRTRWSSKETRILLIRLRERVPMVSLLPLVI